MKCDYSARAFKAKRDRRVCVCVYVCVCVNISGRGKDGEQSSSGAEEGVWPFV